MMLTVLALACPALAQVEPSFGPNEFFDPRIQPVIEREAVDYTNLLPAHPDPNFFLSSPFAPAGQLGDAYALSQSRSFLGPTLYSRIGGSANLAATYDTGVVSPFTPSGVTLDGSPALRGSGIFDMSAFKNTNGKLLWDLQTLSTSSGTNSQAFLELDYVDGVVQIRNIYGRIVNEITSINFGVMQSFAAHDAALPTSIIGQVRPVGSLSGMRVASLSITRVVMSRVELGVAIEDPGSDFLLGPPADGVKLSRYPTFVGRIRITGENLWDGIHLAGFTRSFGREEVLGVEDWDYGWGVNCVARKVIGQKHRVYLGAAGGEGVGKYMFGIENAAGPDVIGLSTLTAFGAYAGVSRLWHMDNSGHQLWSNFVAGYSYQGSAAALPAESIKRGRQAFANLIYRVNSSLAFALEYHYLDRNVISGAQGDNHRIGFVVSLSSPSKALPSASSAARMSAADFDAGAYGTMYLRSL